MGYQAIKDKNQKPMSEEHRKELVSHLRHFEIPFDVEIIKAFGKGNAVIDWNKMVELENTWDSGTPSALIFDGTINKLVKIGVLSREKKGNYSIMKGLSTYNPHLPGDPLFFTKRKDAEAYNEALGAWDKRMGVTGSDPKEVVRFC